MNKFSRVAASGVVALIFFILGFQMAIVSMAISGKWSETELSHESANHKGDSRDIIEEMVHQKRTQLFMFDPNTISRDSLELLGFSTRQAEVIINYRNKGGKFRKPSDFAKIYVVDSSKYAQLKPYIIYKRVNINSADSAEFTTIYGIGPYFARKIVEYREALGGRFTSFEQLLDIKGFNIERLNQILESIEL